MLGRVLLISMDCSTLPLIRTLYCWVSSKEVSSTILKIFGMTRPGIEPRSAGRLANDLPTWPMSQYICIKRIWPKITNNSLDVIKPNQTKLHTHIHTHTHTHIYMYRERGRDLELNNLQWLICYKTQPNQIIYI